MEAFPSLRKTTELLKLIMQEPKKPFLLLANDDGITAPGLRFLIETLRPVAELFVVAPDSPRSGGGMSLTITQPVTARLVRQEEGITEYACSGTPTDCVKLAMGNLLGGRRPDLVVSGINHGDNASVNVHYSGTMGAVIEGSLHGIPAIGFSLCDHSLQADFTPLHDYLIDFVFKSVGMGLPPYTCLNINFPKTDKFRGVKICRQTPARWQREFEERQHPHGGKYYWMTGELENLAPGEDDTDLFALREGYIAVTPVQVDMTCYGLIDVLRHVM